MWIVSFQYCFKPCASNTQFVNFHSDLNETQTWGDHVNYISTKVNQRLGILRRIKHFLPIHIRELYVKSMILPLLDYSDIVWWDKHNKTLMAKVQLLQNKAAKLILDKAKHSSAMEAISELDWLVLSERQRQHRLFFLYLNACMDWLTGILILCTQGKPTLITLDTKTTSKCPNLGASGGQQRLTYQAIHEWNDLPLSMRNSNSLDLFKKLV